MNSLLEKAEIIIITLASPILIGIYADEKLQETIKIKNQISDELSSIMQDITNRFNIQTIIYTSGPGSFLSTKLTYVFLKTLSLTTGAKLQAVEGFAFNETNPIKSVMGQCFIKENDQIIIAPANDKVGNFHNFKLPTKSSSLKFRDSCEPFYIAPATY